MAEALAVQKMFSDIAPSYDLANSVLSFGIHHLWRKSLISMSPGKSNKLVLDLCTGTGDLIPLLSKRYGNVVGADFCYPMLKLAKNKSGNSKASGILQADALNLPFANQSFDIVTVAFGVRNFENLKKGLIEIKRILKNDGIVLILEFGQPKGLLFGNLYKFYSKYVMPFIGGLISGNKKAYEYLPETASQFPCDREFCNLLNECNFSDVIFKKLTGGIAYCYRAGGN